LPGGYRRQVDKTTPLYNAKCEMIIDKSLGLNLFQGKI